jgi:hypothetical protein
LSATTATATGITTTVTTTPTASLSGTPTVTVGATTQFTNSSTAGGTWTSSNGNATVDANGLVTGVSAGTAIITYSATVSGCTASDTRTVTVSAAQCVNPTAGGTIAASKSTVTSNESFSLTSTVAPSGQSGTIEYKWQRSTRSATQNFSDIANSNSETLNPGTISVTTWYKRLVRVSCKSNWTGAAESNVVQVTVQAGGGGSECTTPDNFEPNNTQKDAGQLTLGHQVSANLSAANDQDWYKITIPSRGQYTISFTPDGAAGATVVNGSSSKGVVSLNGVGQANKAFVMVLTLDAGTTLIKISDSQLKSKLCYTLNVVSGAQAVPTNSEARESFEEVELEPALLKMNVDVVASPNPVKDQLQVVITDAGYQPNVRVQLLSTDQRVQGTYLVPVLEGRAEQTIDLRQLPEGTYILTVDGQHGRVSRKVLKMN